MGTLHLKVLGLGDPERMGDPAFVRQFILDLIARVNMTPLGEPRVHDVPLDVRKLGREPFEDEGGVTAQLVGFATLSTSHLALHTWPLRREFHLDLYSCREFDKEGVLSFIRSEMGCGIFQESDLTKHCLWEIPQSPPLPDAM